MLNGVGALVWSVTIGWLGFLFGAAAEHVFEHIKRYETYVLAAIAIVGAVLWLIRRIRTIRESRRDDAVSEAGSAAECGDPTSGGAHGK